MSISEIRLDGTFSPASFKAWICDRARLLDLRGSVTSQGSETMIIVVQGPQALVDAMEMACSLGPMDALVRHIEVRPRFLNEELKTFQDV